MVAPSRSFGPNGRYKAVRRLASGGMGEVWLSRIEDDAAKIGLAPGLVVVKRTFKNNPHQEHANTLLREESRLALRLRHENLVETFTLDDDVDSPLLVMEYLAGRSMAQVLGDAKRNEDPIPWRVALAVLRASACGLFYAHTLEEDGKPLGLIHRDVSPANIFVTFDGRIKVIDFGVAKSQDSQVHTTTGVLKGKLGYMSPEHGSGEALTARADLWSLGVVFWESLAAKRLFAGQNPAMTLRRIATLEVPAPSSLRSDIPESVDAICADLLQRDLHKRIKSAAQLVDRIDRVEGFRASQVDVGSFLRARFEALAIMGEKESKDCATPIDRAPPPAGLVAGDAAVDAATLVVSKSELAFLRNLGQTATVQENTAEQDTGDKAHIDETLQSEEAPTLQMSREEIESLQLRKVLGQDPTATVIESGPIEEAKPQTITKPGRLTTQEASKRSVTAPQRTIQQKVDPDFSQSALAFGTFGILAVVMGIVAALFAGPDPWVLYFDDKGDLNVVAHKEDAPSQVNAFFRLPNNQVPLNEAGTLVKKRSEVDALLEAWSENPSRSLPHTTRARLSRAFPLVVLWLGLLSLVFGLSAHLKKRQLVRALFGTLLFAALIFGVVKGALGFGGLQAFSKHDANKATLSLPDAFKAQP